MTIIYNTSDHAHVVFNLHGSVWPRVLPFCLLNILITIFIYNLPHYVDVDITFDGGLAYQFISVLVSFFTISRLSTTYDRFWEARGYLGIVQTECSLLAARAALFTAHDPSDRADAWRITLKNTLKRFIDEALFMIQDGNAALLFNVIDCDNTEAHDHDLEHQGLKKSDHLLGSLRNIAERRDVMACAMDVDATILTFGDHVEKGGGSGNLIDELLGRSAAIVDAYFKLIKFSTTPVPFVMTQMGRTLLLAWVFTLPAAVLNSHPTEPYESLFLIFLVTYGFVGLTLVEIELHDPLGNDDNDLETARYLKLIKSNIEDLLGKDSLSSEGELLSSPYTAANGGSYQTGGV